MTKLQLLVIGALCACGSSKEAAPRPTREATSEGTTVPTIEVRRGTELVERTVARDVDVWRWCTGAVTSIIARGRRTFVQGACPQRDDQRFELTTPAGATATATLSDDAGVIATATDVHTLELGTAQEVFAELPGLVIEIAGRSPVLLDAATLETLRPERKQREGIELSAVLARAGVPRPARAVIHGDTSYPLEATWLHQPVHELRLRRNRRGQLRFSHREGGVERTRVSAVTRIEITP